MGSTVGFKLKFVRSWRVSVIGQLEMMLGLLKARVIVLFSDRIAFVHGRFASAHIFQNWLVSLNRCTENAHIMPCGGICFVRSSLLHCIHDENGQVVKNYFNVS